MKLRIYFRPAVVVLLLGLVAALLWFAVCSFGLLAASIAEPLAILYTLLFALCAWALWRIHVLERWAHWDKPERLLILAPHEDELRDFRRRHRGAQRPIWWRHAHCLFSTPTKHLAWPSDALRRAAVAWSVVGLEKGDLQHLDLPAAFAGSGTLQSSMPRRRP